MQCIKTKRKGTDLNTPEKYHTHKISTVGLYMNDTYNETHNLIFETLHEKTQDSNINTI
jgi:hypothetical protein